MKVTIDRFEGDFAVVLTDEGKRFDVPKSLFENGKEGDVFDIRRNLEETNSRRKKIEKLMNEVWK